MLSFPRVRVSVREPPVVRAGGAWAGIEPVLPEVGSTRVVLPGAISPAQQLDSSALQRMGKRQAPKGEAGAACARYPRPAPVDGPSYTRSPRTRLTALFGLDDHGVADAILD